MPVHESEFIFTRILPSSTLIREPQDTMVCAEKTSVSGGVIPLAAAFRQ